MDDLERMPHQDRVQLTNYNLRVIISLYPQHRKQICTLVRLIHTRAAPRFSIVSLLNILVGNENLKTIAAHIKHNFIAEKIKKRTLTTNHCCVRIFSTRTRHSSSHWVCVDALASNLPRCAHSAVAPWLPDRVRSIRARHVCSGRERLHPRIISSDVCVSRSSRAQSGVCFQHASDWVLNVGDMSVLRGHGGG